ncbi:XRE family transcriptional regulator [Microbacterium sp. SLBN-154]|uniref:helix-turn-helix domain-containing protein n=1 Tax=Microbacterium sp. SLBN-154 TaxID=2768458 RepID=UPI001174ACB8|nr:XRE family transcriptional regulator [Microbacterium sp. SLBN-154]TQK17645.1 XRE family transcriptional regulator [Microbacterium sp. SLBN-154]
MGRSRTDEGDTGARSSVVGARIRELRRSRGLTLVELARRSALSHSFLSQVENGRARPSFSSLDRIARALGTTQVDVFAALNPVPIVSAAPGALIVTTGMEGDGAYLEGGARVLVETAQSFTPLEYLAANEDFGEYFIHDEEEFCYVVDGVVEVDFGAAEPVVIPQGGAFYYSGGTPHRYRSPTGAPYRVIVVKQRLATPYDPSAREDEMTGVSDGRV